MNKLCKDCKHFTPDTVTWHTPQLQQRYAICALTSRVTGIDGTQCSVRRSYRFRGILGDDCSWHGYQWEPRDDAANGEAKK